MNPSPRECLLHILLGAVRGGCERDCEMVVRYLPNVLHRVLVLGDDGPMVAAWAAAGASVDVRGPTAAWRIRRAVRDSCVSHRPTAAVAWHGLPHLPQILAGLKPSGARVGVHGGNPAHTMPRAVDWRYVLLGAFHPVRRLPLYICCSRHVADSFEQSRYLRRFPRTVVLNGVELPAVGHQPRPFTPAERFVVGMHARMDRIKDHATVLKAFARLRQTCPRAVLEFAGGGEEEKRVRALAAELGIGGVVRFLGSVENVYAALAGWDLYAYATTAAEGMGNAPAEAMMLGLPSVMTDVGPIREVCGPGETAVLVPPADPNSLSAALAHLAAAPELRIRLSEAARKWARAQFHPAVFARRYAELLLPPGADA